jgi:hypothetical protein
MSTNIIEIKRRLLCILGSYEEGLYKKWLKKAKEEVVFKGKVIRKQRETKYFL